MASGYPPPEALPANMQVGFPALFAPLVDLWTALSSQITPFNIVITIPLEIYVDLDEFALQWIKEQYRYVVGDHVSYIRDGEHDRVFLGPERCFPAHGLELHPNTLPILVDPSVVNDEGHELAVMRPAEGELALEAPPAEDPSERDQSVLSNVTNEASRPAKIPRPPNAFILYRQDKQAIVKAENPEMHNNNISVLIGKMWHNETEEVRASYKEKAEVIRIHHRMKHPDYHYRPRKPSEKKRRMTKRKLEALMMADAKIDQGLGNATAQPVQYNQITGSQGVQEKLILPARREIAAVVHSHNGQVSTRRHNAPEFNASKEFIDSHCDEYGLVDWNSVPLKEWDDLRTVSNLIEPDGTVQLGTVRPGAYLWG